LSRAVDRSWEKNRDKGERNSEVTMWKGKSFTEKHRCVEDTKKFEIPRKGGIDENNTTGRRSAKSRKGGRGKFWGGVLQIPRKDFVCWELKKL